MKEFDLPAGYSAIQAGDTSIAVMSRYADVFSGFKLSDPPEPHPLGQRGRGFLISMALAADDSEPALIRRYLRGGILGRLLKDSFARIGRARPFRELMISEYARAAGVPTPEIVAAVVQRTGPFTYRGALATRQITPGVDLREEALAYAPDDRQAIGEKRRCISSLGRLIARMHAAGIYHADLHLKNILKSGEQLYLLDLDGAAIHVPLPEYRKRMNLLRLYRSVQKINQRRRVITRTDLLRFVHAYAAASQTAEEDLLQDIKKMLPLWRLKWRLSDLLKV